MGRGWKIAIGVVAALGVLVAINAVVTDAETKPAQVTEPDGRIVSLPGGDLEVTEAGSHDGSPIVLVHCFTCAIDWWDGMIPRLARGHRVVAVDLLGHGGSEKPTSGYEIENQADLVAGVLGRLGVRGATVVGHSLGGTVSVALAERSPALVDRVVIIDSEAEHEQGDLGLLAKLAFTPLIGDALWRIKSDFTIRQGLEVAFAPGFDVPDAFVEDVKAMTYNSYDRSAAESQAYSEERGLAERMRDNGRPLLAIMGAEEQIIDDPRAALKAYAAAVPGAQTELLAGVGHSPNVEAPAKTAALVLAFARQGMQKSLQKTDAVRKRP
jgi:pimeloyl-ACP methyl ester carboxylesterase